ncbi:proton-conducting transporter membrane subunit [Salinibacter altiplanensis]|uniref:proton-conducting transporter transmembrane domain-containing protein n=1 Tax=Salinibacter altiplanensis TaxID=1803181 RepID=UPI000C9F1438|nr:proton-conducting transporter membrane subunit [Salinibacter altiplanensis]
MSRSSSWLPLLFTRLTWGLFALSLGTLVWSPNLEGAGDVLLRVDGLARVMALVTTFVSGIVHSFSRRYMAGAKRLNAFYGRLFGLTLIVLVLTAANHLVLFAGAWAAMGWVLADLIGHVRGWPQARAASRYARQHFLGGSVLLAAALGLLGGGAEAWTISGVLAAVGTLPTFVVAGAAGLLLLVAMVQSALVPFHWWLLSSMTAPTPVSAFMHAGLVNAGGVLLARFAPVVFEFPVVMSAIVLVGGVSALLGQAWMLVQTDVKRQLGASTVAQMGFMVLQCGLGFIPAAIAHLILHGFYKAYLFLASGSAVKHTAPGRPEAPGTGVVGGLVTAAAAIGGGGLFALLTGKSLTALNSGTVLTAFVVLAVLHATRTLVRRSSLSRPVRIALVPSILLPTLALYAGIYKGVGVLFVDVPSAAAPTALTPLHAVLLVVFGGAYVAVERGWHRASTRLYVALRNTAQPLSTTLLNNRDQYNAH